MLGPVWVVQARRAAKLHGDARTRDLRDALVAVSVELDRLVGYAVAVGPNSGDLVPAQQQVEASALADVQSLVIDDVREHASRRSARCAVDVSWAQPHHPGSAAATLNAASLTARCATV